MEALASLQEQVTQLRVKTEIQILLWDKVTLGLRDDYTDQIIKRARDTEKYSPIEKPPSMISPDGPPINPKLSQKQFESNDQKAK